MTSFCLSPSTSANLRLISEYLSCNSFSSVFVELSLSFNDDSSVKTSLSRPSSPLLSITGISASFSDKCAWLSRSENDQNWNTSITSNHKLVLKVIKPLEWWWHYSPIFVRDAWSIIEITSYFFRSVICSSKTLMRSNLFDSHTNVYLCHNS